MSDQLIIFLQMLDSETTYAIQILVRRLDGSIGGSDVISVTTCAYGFEGIGCSRNMRTEGAFNLLIETSTSTAISFSWTIENLVLQSLVIQYRTRGVIEWSDATSITDISITSYVLHSLQVNTYYEVQLVAVFNSVTVIAGVTYVVRTCAARHSGPNCQSSYAVCAAYGDPHYITFDGLAYDFQGECDYILAKDCQQDPMVPMLPLFDIVAQNRKLDTNARVTYTREVTMNLFGVDLALMIGGEVRISGVRVNLPVLVSINVTGYAGLDRVYDVYLYHMGIYIVLETDFGVAVAWDTESVALIKMPSSFWNATCGLCGNYDSEPMNDPATPNGDIVSSAAEFGDSWVYNRLQCSAETDDVEACDGVDEATKNEAMDICSILTNVTGPFEPCHHLVDTDIYVSACIYDLCETLPELSDVCDSLQVYAQTCIERGGSPREWRSSICPIDCPADLVYSSCATACPATCSNPDAPSRCMSPCIEGCQCPAGKLLDKGVCIDAVDCGCSDNGKYYSIGETYTEEGCYSTCTCGTDGIISCTDTSCSGTNTYCGIKDGVYGCHCFNGYQLKEGTCEIEHATCIAYGDPHYITFDGKHYDFQGDCEYVLATSNCSHSVTDMPYFKVVGKNQKDRPSDRVSFTREVYITIGEMTISLLQGLRVDVNGSPVTLPYSYANSDLSVIVKTAGRYVKLITSFQLVILWDTVANLVVYVPYSYSNSTCGLCGTLNFDPRDDFIIPGGNLVVNVTTFGENWIANQNECTVPTPPEENPCDVVEEMIVAEANESCHVILNTTGPFGGCHEFVDPWPYYESCLYDMCAILKEESLCDVLGAYTTECMIAGALVQRWRTDQFCRLDCPERAIYTRSASACPNTCIDTSANRACQEMSLEGCECPDGMLLDGSRCVTPSECGCRYEGHIYPIALTPAHVRQTDELCANHLNVTPMQYARGMRLNNIDALVSMDLKETGFKHVNSVIELLQDGEVFINGTRVILPFETEDGVEVFFTGRYVRLLSGFGPKITWDTQNMVAVNVPQEYRNATCGLCGNFDGDDNNDFIGPEFTLIEDVTEFGDSWLYNSEICDVQTDPVEPCDDRQQEELTSIVSTCSIISDSTGPFRQCHSHIDYARQNDSCVYDYCATYPVNYTVCENFEVLAYSCMQLNIELIHVRPILSIVCALTCVNQPVMIQLDVRVEDYV
ncbi:alpha-tectorin-like [Saccoglossus kowalevskii]